MPNDNVIIRFADVTFEFGNKKILDEASFSVRQGSKITLMGQNGAGKTTLFQMIMGTLSPEEGDINIDRGMTMAIGRQVIPRDQLGLTVTEFFETAFPGKKIYDLEPRITKILDVVHLDVPHDRPLKKLSGGQQARILLAHALIQNPDILLLDEPTNNLDKAGIKHLTQFLIEYPKTVIVISHDAEFLNSFTHGVLYLDVFTHKLEQYTGNYFDVVKEISARLERERMLNVRLQRDIMHRKEQANFFAQKGGHMRDVARKMNEKISELEEDIVDVRQEDKTIRDFRVQAQSWDPTSDMATTNSTVLKLDSLSLMDLKTHKPVTKKVKIVLKRKEHLLLSGPNGIGKTTLLETLASGHAKGEHITLGTKISYYRQDFSTLDFNETVYRTLADAATGSAISEQEMRSCAAGFLIDADLLKARIGSLSEGQKGLVSFAKIVLERPGLLILDEPTNHINFRHLPVIAAALNRYEGGMILVSHVPDFVAQIRIDHTLDLEAL